MAMWRFGVLAVLTWLLVALPALAQGEAPVLRIETGGHTARAVDAAIDGAGRVLVTASDDKTARVWSLPDLRPLGVLRPAIGPGNEGMLYAVAVSPDGRLAAVGGWTTPTDDQAVLVFDLATRQVVRRLAGLPSGVEALAFSRDGRLLAAGLGSGGIRVWNSASWRQVFADSGYAGEVYGLSFAPDGRLAAGSYDGGLRLYAPDGRRLVRAGVPAGRRPSGLAFSADGAVLAVGFANAVAVELRDGATLALRSRSDTARLGEGFLSRVAWSADRRTLLAGGWVLVPGDSRHPVFAWDDHGRGPRRITDPGFDTNTMALVPLPDRGFFLLSSRGELAVLDPAGGRGAGRSPVGQDLNGNIDPAHVIRGLLLSADGAQASWVARGAPGRWLRFDAAGIAVAATDTPPAGLADWSDRAGPLHVTDWFASTAPKLNGRALTLEPNEVPFSVAVALGRVLLGTQWSVHLFDAQGTERWQQPVPAIAWRVNQSADGRLAVAATNDGMLRWHRLDNGRELLALFVTADAQRWVALAPSGYFATSPGGEDLIGWHLNRGLDQAADFFPASRFRDRFYRPDVVQRALATLDEAEALRQADAARGARTRPQAPITADLPPVITIIAPADGSILTGPDILVEYTLRSPSGRAVRSVEARIDERRADGVRGLEPIEETLLPAGQPDSTARGHLLVSVPGGRTVTLTLLATSETGRVSEPATLRLTGAPAVAADLTRPRLFALLAGISNYPDPALRLRYADNDAAALAELLRRQQGAGLYREVDVRLIPEAQATRIRLLRELENINRSSNSNDYVIIFLAGHGVTHEGTIFFLPVDGDLDLLFGSALSQPELLARLASLHGKVLALLDFCHAGGAVLAQRGSDAPDMTELVNLLRDPSTGVMVLAAATARQPAVELDALRHGAFTQALLEGLQGRADLRHRGFVSVLELNAYVVGRVRDLTAGRQSPVLPNDGRLSDFPLAMVHTGTP